MAWTYNDWASQSTPAARLTRLRLHIDEVSAQISADISASGKSRSTSTLQTYLDGLMNRMDRLEQQVGSGPGRRRRIVADFRG